MKMFKFLAVAVFVFSLLVGTGCESKTGTAVLGAAGGAVATGGGYEYKANREMKRIEDDFNAGRIDQREYEIRKDQIQRMSVLE